MIYFVWIGLSFYKASITVPHKMSRSLQVTLLSAQDEEAELLAELERIKKEREEAAAKRAAEEAAVAASSLQEELIRGNPLIVGKFDKSSDFQVRPIDCRARVTAPL